MKTSENGYFKAQILEIVKESFIKRLKKKYGCEWVTSPRSGVSRNGNIYITIVFPVSQEMLALLSTPQKEVNDTEQKKVLPQDRSKEKD